MEFEDKLLDQFCVVLSSLKINVTTCKAILEVDFNTEMTIYQHILIKVSCYLR